MDVERNLIIAILKLTKVGPVSHELTNKETTVASEIAQKLLRKLQSDGLIYVKKGAVEADSLQRLKLAIKAVNLGADLERVGGFLCWQEFENMAAFALAQKDYTIEKNLRFKHAGRRWEIDIVGCRKPIAVCIDCKHWHHGMYSSVLKKIVEEQIERTCALAEFLPSLSGKVACACWNKVKLVPAILLLVAGRFKFYDNVPLIPVLQLQDFLNHLPAYADSLRHFTKQLTN
mgnify:CR=1 FL=1